MLVLSRRAGQAIAAGNLTISVLEVRGNQVRLGLDAPRDLRILRTELIAEPRIHTNETRIDPCSIRVRSVATCPEALA